MVALKAVGLAAGTVVRTAAQWAVLTVAPWDAQSVALIPIGNIPDNQVEQLQLVLAKALGNTELLVTRDLLSSRNCTTQLLVTAPGAPQRQQLQQMREQLALQGKPLAGWLLIDPALEA